MEAHVATAEYKDVVLFLATAGIIVPLFRRWQVSPILGFLIAGVVLGPFGLGSLSGNFPWLATFTISQPEEIAQLAELGVVFLLFMIGLELSWERLRLMRRLVFGMGALQVLLCIVVIAIAGVFLGLPVQSAAIVGAALALSSTAIVMPLLAEQKTQHSKAGRGIFSILLFQDLAVAPILVTIAVIGTGEEGEILSPSFLLTFAPAALGLLILFGFGRLLLRPMMKSVARAKSEELFMAASLLVVIGAGLLAAVTGLSMALGAFIAGILLAETEFRHEVERTIEPFKGLLLGVFFVSVGIGLDLSLLMRDPVQIIAIAIGMMVLTGGVVYALSRFFGRTRGEALQSALLLAPGGEFAFVIIDTAIHDNAIDFNAGQTVLVAATLTMFAIPFLGAIGARVGRAGVAKEPEPSEAPENSGGEKEVLIVGYGRVGQLVGEMLDNHNIPWVAAERDAKSIEPGRRAGKKIYFGDAARREFLIRCGLETAPALVITMDSPEAAEAVVGVARTVRPDLTIVARARDAHHAQKLYELGATDAVPETIEASLQLSETVLVEIGVPMGLVIASVHERRDEIRKMLNRPDALGGRTRRAARDSLKSR